MSVTQAQEDNKRSLGVVWWLSHLLLLALMISLAIWAARWGWAEVLVAEPRDVMSRWKTGQPMPSVEEMNRLDDLLLRAQSLNENDADIAFDQGRFAEWRASRYPLWSKEAHSHREAAIEYFREAISLRSSWGLAWVNLANSLVLNQQLYLGGMDALEKAAILAPAEGDVQQRIIWLGLSQWRHADDELRVRLRDILESILKVQSYVVVQTIVDFRLEKELGDLAVSDEDQELLNNMLSKRKAIDSRKR